jgi:hypothetical protein
LVGRECEKSDSKDHDVGEANINAIALCESYADLTNQAKASIIMFDLRTRTGRVFTEYQ